MPTSSNVEPVRQVAIVGSGPRGLAALECLYAALAESDSLFPVRTVLFERSGYPGSGPNYAPDLFSGCLLNVPERLLDLDARIDLCVGDRLIPGFPSYREWSHSQRDSDPSEEVDHYPPRSLVGKYLVDRLQSIVDPLQQWGWLRTLASEVIEVRLDDSIQQFGVRHSDGWVWNVDEVLLTIGHQDTELDSSMKRWSCFAADKDACTLIPAPYPMGAYIQDEHIDEHSTVALRGFGLSMIDVVRGLSEGRGGKFVLTDERLQTLTYKRSGREPSRIIPFSLDGLPLAAKPLDQKQDQKFLPDSPVREAFVRECSELASLSQGYDAYDALVDAVSHVQARVFARLQANDEESAALSLLSALAVRWLGDPELQHALIVSRELPTELSMRRFVDMACGVAPASFDYCLGQVWRHLQHDIFHALSHSSISLQSMSKILDLHECMKRYAFGPPVESMRCLLALHADGMLSFAVVDDPDILVSSEGWKFQQADQEVTAAVMIDTVLSSASAEQVSHPLLRQLLEAGMLCVQDGLPGISTDSDGLAALRKPDCAIPRIALLGRLATGSIIGADSLTESFGEQPRQWARGAVARMDSGNDRRTLS